MRQHGCLESFFPSVQDPRFPTALSQATLGAAQAADQAAGAVEAALPPIDTLEGTLETARQKRDALGPTWDAALAALRRRTRIAADDGAPHLHATLFGRQPAKAKRTKRPQKPAPGTGTEPPAATTAAQTASTTQPG